MSTPRPTLRRVRWTGSCTCPGSGRSSRAGIPDGTGHQEKWRLALSLLDNVSGWEPTAPVVIADAGYGVSTPFRHGLEERGLSYVLALTGKEVAHELNVEPCQPTYGGLGPPALPRYRTAPRALSLHAAEAVAAGQGRMTSRFAVLVVRPAGKQSLAAVQAAGGGRGRRVDFWVEAPEGEEGLGGSHEGEVVVPAPPGAALEVIETEAATPPPVSRSVRSSTPSCSRCCLNR